MIKKFGSIEAWKEYQRQNGSKGGKAGTGHEFAHGKIDPSRAGHKAGDISKCGMKYIGEDNGVRSYIANDTGMVVKYEYDSKSKKYERIN
jgi:hypothetical protein